jgi:hypothetical protein
MVAIDHDGLLRLHELFLDILEAAHRVELCFRQVANLPLFLLTDIDETEFVTVCQQLLELLR